MKKYSIALITIICMQSSLRAEGWFKTNWDKFKNKLENVFDKNKKSTSKAETKTKPIHEQAYELHQEMLKLQASANSLEQKIVRAKFELKQMEEKHASYQHEIKEKQAKIKSLNQPEVVHHVTEHKYHEIEHKHVDGHKSHHHAEHKTPQILHTKKPQPKPSKK